MKINIELDMTPQEAKELFTITPNSLNPFQLMMFDKFKQQWLDDGKPASDFWQQMNETGGQQSMMEYWNDVGKSFFNPSSDSKKNDK